MRSIEGFYFVYTLSYNDHVFYIGCCQDVVRRYSQHLNKKNGPMASHINTIKNKGHLPTLNIITFRPEIEARSVEEALIKCLSIGGHKLFNNQHYRFVDKPILNKGKKEACKILSKEQEYFRTIAQSWHSYYRPSIRKIETE